ncbi:MAG: ATP-binding protein [Hallerella porci]|uniref:ATP-binding protein n=1 Tax=Hallerella TaxID=2815788 RepID=UPI000D05495F|nr:MULTISPECIES: ATP-binding protein [Hallerella]MCI5599889.1 ATP-binding protein [Hallerella sp.]MDY3920638.1 ATP-binding protein [Hallerella porci]
MKKNPVFRDYAKKILESYKDTPVIKVITGIRRAGKSFVLELLQESLLKTANADCVIKIDFEDFDNQEFLDLQFLYSFIKKRAEKTQKKLYLLFDEIQELEGWEKCINSLYSSQVIDCDIYITGSNAKLLSSELATYISGRYVNIQIQPLSYQEFLRFHKTKDSKNVFNKFLSIGGFPGLKDMKSKDSIESYLEGIYSTVLLKDIIQRNNIRDTNFLEKMILYVCDNIGNIFSANTIAKFMKSQRRSMSVETIYNNLKFLEEAFVIYKVPRFDLKGKKILETLEKYYLADQGIKYFLQGFKDSHINGILENIVFVELIRRGYKVYVGKFGELEIDFIAQKNEERIYIQVCYLMADENTKAREYLPLTQIKDNYPKLILSLDDLPKSNEGGIIRMNLREWLLKN